jgi:hypothetical protein
MDYQKKYLKYKTKYNTLKIQMGGKMLKGGAGLDLFFPSDIYNLTEKFMIYVDTYDDKFKKLLGDKFSDLYLHIGTEFTQKFIQDPAIIFNIHPSGKKYIICLADNCVYDDVPELSNASINKDFKSSNELLFGGNFISTPSNPNIPENRGVIITTKTQDINKNIELDKLLDFLRLNINSNQKIITIKCSFQHASGSIHIDELLCTMPYKLYDVFSGYKMNYKIWIYKIVNININDTHISKINEYNVKNSEYAKRLEKRKQFEDNDPRKKNDNIGKRFALHSDDELKVISRNFLDAKDKFNLIPFGSPLRRKYKEETIIDDYKFGDLFNYSTFFNYILDPDFNKEIVKEEGVKVVLADLKEKLLKDFNDELEENKRIIAENIFTPDIYNQHKDMINRNFFVEYHVDLTFRNIIDNGIYGFNMLKPPIFNRVFIKSEDKNYCVIPINQEKPSQVLLDFINRESEFMEPINFEYINTGDYHIEGGTGGNIHCLSKQIFK